jgi:SNF2 family DNA or RNA helicase
VVLAVIVIREKTILNGCISVETYQRGISYFNNNRVYKLDYRSDEELYYAEVKGSHRYEVLIGIDAEGEVGYAECDCLAFESYGGFCKHIVAVLYKIREWLEQKDRLKQNQDHGQSQSQSQSQLNKSKGNLQLIYSRENELKTGAGQGSFGSHGTVLAGGGGKLEIVNRQQEEERQKAVAVAKGMLEYVYRRQEEPVEKVNLVVEPALTAKFNGRTGSLIVSLSLRIGEDKLYVVKNMEQFLWAVEEKKELVFGKKFTFDPWRHGFSQADQRFIEVLLEIYQVNKLIFPSYGYYDSKEKLLRGKEAILAPGMAEKVLSYLKGRVFSAEIVDKFHHEVEVLEEDLPLGFKLTRDNKDLVIEVDFQGNILPMNKDGRFFFYQGKIYHTSREQQQKLVPFYYAMTHLGKKMVLPEEYQEQFIADLYPWLTKVGQVTMDEELAGALYQYPLLAQVYLDEEEGTFLAEVKYCYGEYTFDSLAGNGEREIRERDRIIVRDREKEQAVMQCFEEGDFKVQGKRLYLDEQDKVFEFIYTQLPKLQEKAEVYYSERLKKVQLRPASFRGRIGINSDTDLLEIGFELEGVEREELGKIFSSLKEKKKFYRLKDGSFLSLDQGEMLEMAELLEGLEIKKTDLAKDVIRLPKYRALQLDQTFQENKLNFFRKNKSFKELVQNIKEPGDMDFPVPAPLEGILRDYQRVGFAWLKTMAAYGFGGILADEMGLGKTIQAIAFIYSERDRLKEPVPNQGQVPMPEQPPVLVVAPTSVVYNWQAEINRFTPELAVKVISGIREERQAQLANLEGIDVIITSYALLRRDIGDYQKQKLSCLLLDEAQYIKNPNSLTAKAAKQIPAANVVALTGTPMENSLTELWSIFDCTMPGYLYSHQKFMVKFGKAVEREKDREAAVELARRLSPFILRRLKKDVLAELPEKIEHKLVSELTQEQKKLYLAYWDRLRREAMAEIGRQGFEKSRIKILAGLTRLRQICCHPALFLENYRGKSGKLEQLQELVRDGVDGGHRILIFSQFTAMLKLIGETLEKDSLDYFYLDGSVQAQKRLEMANAFNAGEKKLFLVSLKAGGTGLNLTGADMVIHFDLWWNPAVEDQASDRAHRIGQKRSVQVMKLVSLGTIEEKIYELQQHKKELVDRVIKPGESMLTTLSEEEIKRLLEL